MDEFVNVEMAHEAQIRIAVTAVVNDMRFVGNEMSEQGACKQPLSHCCVTAFDIAERNLH